MGNKDLHPLIYIVIVIVVSMITSIALSKLLYPPDKKTVIKFSIITILGYIFSAILIAKLFNMKYPDRYNKIWGIMSFIAWTLYAIVAHDRKITRVEFSGLLLTIVGMLVIYSEQ